MQCGKEHTRHEIKLRVERMRLGLALRDFEQGKHDQCMTLEDLEWVLDELIPLLSQIRARAEPTMFHKSWDEQIGTLQNIAE